MIPVNEPFLGGREKEYVLDCLRTGWISSSGKFIEDFERGWAAYCGMKHGVAVSNGTTALEAAVEALQLKPSDEVILPTFTIISCITAVLRCGAVPVLVDANPETWCMDVNQVAARVTPRTRAIMPVHIYGHPVDMDPVLAVAQKYHLAVVEDAAEAHGAEYLSGRDGPHGRWRRCGGMGTCSTFSFYANKLITTGEGGMVLTDDDALACKVRGLRNLCFRPEQRFLHTELGHNFRITNLQAAIGLAQLERFPDILERKRRLGSLYTAGLRGVPDLQLPAEAPWARSVYWMYGVVLGDSRSMDAPEFARRLRNEGVETRPFFLGMHEQPALQDRGLFRGEQYPVAGRIARRGLYLPSGLTLTDSQVAEVCEKVKKVLR